jgi:hypothetical protein
MLSRKSVFYGLWNSRTQGASTLGFPVDLSRKVREIDAAVGAMYGGHFESRRPRQLHQRGSKSHTGVPDKNAPTFRREPAASISGEEVEAF